MHLGEMHFGDRHFGGRHLGDMTGLEVAALLAKDVRAARIPRFALSADALPPSIDGALAAGFSAFLTSSTGELF